jgi:hypothetical protein
MPAGLAVGGGGLACDAPGAVVVVVVGLVGVDVVVVVEPLDGGAVVVVVVVVDEGTVVGCVVDVVVVVVLLVVVVVLLEVVVVGDEGVVVVVVVVVGVAAGAVPVVGAGVVLGEDTVIVAPVQAPAVCMVATSATIRIKARFSAEVSALSLETACWSALAAFSRLASEARRAASAWSVRASMLEAVTLSYCWATTPLALGGPNLWPDPEVTYELLT